MLHCAYNYNLLENKSILILPTDAIDYYREQGLQESFRMSDLLTTVTFSFVVFRFAILLP